MKSLNTPYDCYIGLGANLGDREGNIRKALEKIKAVNGIEIFKISSIYETEPWGKLDQPPFLNAVAKLRVYMQPHELLADLQCIESELGRLRREHWGARTIDLDIICIPGVTLQTEQLTLPHPYFSERAFVLLPFMEIAAEFKINGITINDYCQHVEGKDGVKYYSSYN